jgi:hypothetical protein
MEQQFKPVLRLRHRLRDQLSESFTEEFWNRLLELVRLDNPNYILKWFDNE